MLARRHSPPRSLSAVVRGRRGWSIATLVASVALLSAGTASAQLPQIPASQPAKARIAFAADGAIHTIAADGSDRRRITPEPKVGVDESPAWSPDGSTLAFTRLALDEDEAIGIWLADRDGANVRPLRVSNDWPVAGPTWSPDGMRIAFVRTSIAKDRYTSSIVSARPDGSDERLIHSESTGLHGDTVFFQKPAWSPGGDRLLFTRVVYLDDDFAESLHVVPAGGGAAPRVVRGGDDAAWHPSGDRIAYTLSHDRHTDRPCFRTCYGADEIYVANADGSGRTRLTNSRASDAAPSWSGDGLRIAFHSDRNATQADEEDSPPEIYSMRADGSCLTWLTNGTAHSEWPAFEPGAGLGTDPGGCGAVPREPLVETDTSKIERFNRFPIWWLGRVAPNGLLLGDADVSGPLAQFSYDDCGRFDPEECGEFVLIGNSDVCKNRRPLPRAGLARNPLSIFRGALVAIGGDREIGYTELYSGRTRIIADTESGQPVNGGVLKMLQRVDGTIPAGARMLAPRLPRSYWATLTRVTAAHRRLRSVNAVARRLDLKPAEVRRRLAAAKRLARLGVKRRLKCSD